MPRRRAQGSLPGQLQEEKDVWGDWDAAGSPCMGILSESLSPPSWTGNSQAGGGGERGAGQVVRGTDSQLEPELHLSAPNFSVPDAFLRDSFVFTLGSGSQRLMRARGVLLPWEGPVRHGDEQAGTEGQAH